MALLILGPIGLGTSNEDCDLLVLGCIGCVELSKKNVDSVQNHAEIMVWCWHNVIVKKP